MNALKIIRLATWALVAVLVVATAVVAWRGQGGSGAGGTATGESTIGGPFTLVGTDGQPVTEAVMKDRAHAVFFGFTHCPDVCPTTLADMTLLLEKLGADADKLDVWFVSVDPERDTPEVMKTYLTSFSGRIRGLTGTEAQIEDMTTKYKVYRRKVPGVGSDYAMDHSAAVLLFGPDGDFRGTLSSGEPEADRLQKLQRLVAG